MITFSYSRQLFSMIMKTTFRICLELPNQIILHEIATRIIVIFLDRFSLIPMARELRIPQPSCYVNALHFHL